MKKLSLGLIVAASLVSTPIAFADTQTTGGYASGQVNLVTAFAKTSKPGLVATVAMPVTNIIIINFTNHNLHARIQGLTVDQPINAGSPGLFQNSNLRSDNFQILEGNTDLFGFVPLCRRAIATIDGGDYGPGSYHMNVERKYC